MAVAIIVAIIFIAVFVLQRSNLAVFVNNDSNIVIGIIDGSLTHHHANIVMSNRPVIVANEAMSHGNSYLAILAAIRYEP